MFNSYTGFKIAVMSEAGGRPFVVVPPEQADTVHQVLVAKGIGHTVEPRVIDGDNGHSSLVIRVGGLWDKQCIQDAIDSVN